MKKENRYKTSHLIEDQYELGSSGRVLKNLLGIKNQREMDRFEAQEQLRTLKELTEIYGTNHKFTAGDIRNIHKIWLGRIYSWAGGYRSVNISKDGFPFAMATHIPKLMEEYEKEVLFRYTPCHGDSHEQIAEALAITHVELLLIHPFREGNGRMARLLSILMALQAGLPVLDFEGIQGKAMKEYIIAIQTGLKKNYQLMKEIFLGVIEKSIKKASLNS